MTTDRSLADPGLDLTLLTGFSFRCRPDCGLCCYAEPAVEPPELARIRSARSGVKVTIGERGQRHLASRPGGGPCQFLRDRRCEIHALRPSPCSMFPVVVHGIERDQATLVLSCPGLDLGSLRGWSPGRARSGTAAGRGLEEEIAAARLFVASGRGREALDRERARWRARCRTLGIETARPPGPDPSAGPPYAASGWDPEPPPPADEGIELLPLYFDERPAPVALSAHPLGVELLELSESGGVARSLGVHAEPAAAPPLEPDASQLLEGYLDYWKARELLRALVAARLAAAEGTSSYAREFSRELDLIRSTVLSRAAVLRAHRGSPGLALSSAAVEAGIRASDADLLDRPW